MFIFSFIIMFVLAAPYDEIHSILEVPKLNQKIVALKNVQPVSQLNFLVEKNLTHKSPIVLDGFIMHYISAKIEGVDLTLYRSTSKLLFLSAYYVYFKTRIHCWGGVYNCYKFNRENCFNDFLFCNFRARRYKIRPPVLLTPRCKENNMCNEKDLKELKIAHDFLTVDSFPNTKLMKENDPVPTVRRSKIKF